MLASSDSIETDEGNEHCHDCTNHVEDTVGHVDLHAELVDEHCTQDEDWDDVDDEVITTPSCYHVEVG